MRVLRFRPSVVCPWLLVVILCAVGAPAAAVDKIGVDMYPTFLELMGREATLNAQEMGLYKTLAEAFAAEHAFRTGTLPAGELLDIVLAVGGETCGAAPLYSGNFADTDDNTGNVDDYDPSTATTCPSAGGGATYTGTGLGPDLVYRINSGAGGVVTVSMDPTGADDLALYILSPTCPAGVFTTNCVVGDDSGGGGTAEQVVFTAAAATDYYVVVDGYNSADGPFSLNATIVAPPANDACANGIAITAPSVTASTTVGASIDAVGTCTTSLNTAPGVWYTFTPATNGTFTASLCGSAYDTKIGVFTGACGALACVIGNDDFCGLQSQVTFTGLVGTTYRILVTGFSSASGTFSLNLTQGTCALTCPANISAPNTTDQCGANVAYSAPTTSGSCGAVTCNPASGSFYAVGTTPVSCTSFLNGGACGFSVTVNDTQAPVLTCPADIFATVPPGGQSTTVDFPPPAPSDNCTGVSGASCAPASGDAFLPGTTVVACTATDAAGNGGNCAFDVVVGSQSVHEIPTASTLGLLALVLLLGGAAFVALRRGA